jgi:hypothetical protein
MEEGIGVHEVLTPVVSATSGEAATLSTSEEVNGTNPSRHSHT